jgi:hyperosmotically inducible protein
MGTDLDDSVITTSVKSALLADASVKSFDINVETRKGEVLLSGFVGSEAQIVQATSVAQGVAGVKGVQNKLALKGADTTAGVALDDGIITGKVKAALLADANVKSFDIAVVTRKDEVQLSGFVNSEAQIERAVALTRQVDGVRTVDNALKIKK